MLRTLVRWAFLLGCSQASPNVPVGRGSYGVVGEAEHAKFEVTAGRKLSGRFLHITGLYIAAIELHTYYEKKLADCDIL